MGVIIKRTHLNRALSKLGLCSRTVADVWILAGRVQVNGSVVFDRELWVELGLDNIEVEGFASTATQTTRAHVYFCVYKPIGCLTTRNDELGRKTIYDLLPPNLVMDWIFPVGRLDKDSEGLLLMTDDGEWANALTDPLFHVDKIYRVKLNGRPREEELQVFREGLVLDGRKTLPAQAVGEGGDWVQVILREGRNRQIRKMFRTLGYKVKRLIRIAIGPLPLGELKPGECRALTTGEVEALSRAGQSKLAN